jgi:hypothetical protein
MKTTPKTQECYPDSRYVVVDQTLVPKPIEPLPQKVYVPVYTAPQPQVYLGFGYTYWDGHRGHCGSRYRGGHHGGHRY